MSLNPWTNSPRTLTPTQHPSLHLGEQPEPTGTGLEQLGESHWPQLPAAGNFQELILIEHHLPQKPMLFLGANSFLKITCFQL